MKALVFFGVVAAAVEIPKAILDYGGEMVPIVVQLQAPTNVIANVHTSEYARGDRKAQLLVDRLQAFEKQSQAPLVQLLDKLKAQNQAGDHRSYFISNTIAVEATKAAVREISAVAGVEQIGCNFFQYEATIVPDRQRESKYIRHVYPEYGGRRPLHFTLPPSMHGPGISQMSAHGMDPTILAAARTLVVGVQDFGVEFDHPALVENYAGNRGSAFDHNFAWFDPANRSTAAIPADTYNHGTGVVALAVGKATGVSPESKWMGCKFWSVPFRLTENLLACQQFLLAPTDLLGNSPNVALRPHVIANAWGCMSIADCLGEPFTYTAHAHHAAGIFNVAAVGNTRPYPVYESTRGCNSITRPASQSHVFAIAALAYNKTTSLEEGSLGPSPFKPNAIDLAVAGSGLLTAATRKEYIYQEGTSFSSPLVAGGALLVMAACPHLQRNPDALAQILRDSATPLYSKLGCGTDTETSTPNNEFGYGLANIKKAIAMCQSTA